MRAARPADGPAVSPPRQVPDPPTGTASRAVGAQPLTRERERPYSAHGRLFFEKEGIEYSCSGTVVRSRNHNLIMTAGHCVYDLGTASFNDRIVFVPAYRDGQAPFGQFPARARYTTSGWVSGGGPGYDIGAITVDEPVQELVGGRRIDFEFEPRARPRLEIFGYPMHPSPPYNGQLPIVCDAFLVRGIDTGTPPSLAASPCDMQQGSSGGGWINSAGYLVSVVSHGYCDSSPETCGVIFGPVLGANAVKIYRRAGGSEPPRLTLARGPRGRIVARRVSFRLRFQASTPVYLECRFSGPGFFRQARRGFRRCGRAPTYRRLRPGRYVFRARLIDQAGRRTNVRRAFAVTVRTRRNRPA